jgi:hypothetical protein
MQLAEMDRAPEGSASTPLPTPSGSNGDLSHVFQKSTDSLATPGGNVEEDDKERTIAKAALSIAELSKFLPAISQLAVTELLQCPFFSHQTLAVAQITQTGALSPQLTYLL